MATTEWLLGEPQTVLVFGDSWVANRYSWAEQWADTQRLSTTCFADNGCTSQDLADQLDACACWAQQQRLRSAVAIVHIGGNDLQSVIFDGDRRTVFLMLALACLQVLLWIMLNIIAIPCCVCRQQQRVAGALLLHVWLPLAALVNVGDEVSLTAELTIHRFEAWISDLEERHEVESFVVSGLPVTPVLPFIQDIVAAFIGRPSSLNLSALGRCLVRRAHCCACGLLGLWCRCQRDLFLAACRRFEGRGRGRRVVFFDEAAALETLCGERGFWEDAVHPSPHGHALLAAEFAKVWKR